MALIADPGLSMSEDFQIAFERARKRVGCNAWKTIRPQDRTAAIYRELRALDAERLAQVQVTLGSER